MKKIILSLFLINVFLAIAAQEPELVLPKGNSNKLDAMAISNDESLYASGDLDGQIKIWEAATGKLLKIFSRKNVTELGFTKDNKGLIIITFDAPEILTIETGRSVFLGKQEYQGYYEGFGCSPDGKWIAVGKDHVIQLWDAKTFRLWKTVVSPSNNSEFRFSKDSKTMIFFGGKAPERWSVEKQAFIKTFPGHTGKVQNIDIGKDNTQFLSASDDSTAKLWDLKTGKLLADYRSHENTVWDVKFHPDGKSIITAGLDNTARLWDKNSGKLIKTLIEERDWIYHVIVSPDGKTYSVAGSSSVLTVFDAATNSKLASFQAGLETLFFLAYLKNNKMILLGTYDPFLIRYNIETRKTDLVYGLRNERFTSISLSNDEKFLLTTSRDGIVRKMDVNTGKILFNKKVFGSTNWATSASTSPDDNLVVVSGGGESSVLLNAAGGLEGKLNDVSPSYESFSKFNSDGKYILHNDHSTVQLIRVADNKRLLTVDSINMFVEQRFSPDGAYLLTAGETRVQVYNVKTARRVTEIPIVPTNLEMSADSKYILGQNNNDNVAGIWETATGKQVRGVSDINYASFSPSGNSIFVVSVDGEFLETDITMDSAYSSVKLEDFKKGYKYHFIGDGKFLVSFAGDTIYVRDLGTGKILKRLNGNEIAYGKSAEWLYVLKDDIVEAYSMANWQLAYRHFIIGADDYLVQDDYGRYDGTEAARKILYFVCGMEVIELEQAKDQLWVPDLAERKRKNEVINAKTIRNLNICNLSPEVFALTNSTTQYNFKIRPRRGGLGETALVINGIEARRYKPAELQKQADGYLLAIKKEDINNFLVSGKENQVSVKAYTADNSFSSRGLIVKENNNRSTATPPNLYAVMVGVSDYKGGELDLKFAAKDATDISSALSAAAKKLLETDGQPHVFMYNLTTNKERYQLPEKNSIKKVLEEIGKKATANDILLIFFAGHGVMAGEAEKKQFYFLTADASTLSTTSAVKDVGISTAELIDWMKPQNMKAQKRILIFDACNSGQAINDIAGKDLAVRNDDKAQQLKAIDKLNEKSGLFILSASASDQSAYEMGRYSQGLLTYALLKAIKQQPEILNDGKYLDVSKWFNAAEQSVSELARETGARQEPQVVSNTNFTIGLVDQEVLSKIHLPQEKPLFAASNFQNNDEAIADDDLELSKVVNLQLSDLASRGTDSRIVYVTATNSPDAYSLTGRYAVKGNTITMTVNLKQNKVIKSKFEVNGTKDKLVELAILVTVKAAELVK